METPRSPRTGTTNADGKKAEVNWEIIKRAQFFAGFKGYVTNIEKTVMDGGQVVAAYRDLWRIEESFRMTKSDLAARPVFHHKQDSIEAHLTVVFAALAVTRYLKTAPAGPSNDSCGHCDPCRP